MAQQKNKSAKQNNSIPAEEKIARLLGLLVVKGIDQRTEQVTVLRAVGFEVAEVAAMLRMTENHVNVATHHGRKGLTRKKTKK